MVPLHRLCVIHTKHVQNFRNDVELIVLCKLKPVTLPFISATDRTTVLVARNRRLIIEVLFSFVDINNFKRYELKPKML